MNFELTDEQTRLRDAVREFAEKEIAPGVAGREKRGEFPREILGRLAEMGVLGMMVPEEYGGAGADCLSYILAIEELSRVCASTAVIVSVNNSVFCYPGLEVRDRRAEGDHPVGSRLRTRPRRLRADRAAVGLRRGEPEDAGGARRRPLRPGRGEGLDHQCRRGEVVRRHGHDGAQRRHARDHGVPGLGRGRRRSPGRAGRQDGPSGLEDGGALSRQRAGARRPAGWERKGRDLRSR